MTLRITCISILAAAGLVSGCAVPVAGQGVMTPTTPRPVATAVQLDLGQPGGYQRRVQLTVPADTCSAEAYTAAFRSEYVRAWNTAVRNREAQVRVRLLNNPPAAAAATLRAEQASLRTKILPAEPSDAAQRYFDPTSRLPAKTCSSSSWAAGQADGIEIGARDARELAAGS